MKNTTLCYLEQNGCYLMLHRVKKKQDENAGKWIGIGGKLEENESPEECCCREFLEETGLTLTDYRYRGIITFVSDQWEVSFCPLREKGRVCLPLALELVSCYNQHEKQKCGSLRARQRPQTCAGADTTYTTAIRPHRMDIIRHSGLSCKGRFCCCTPASVLHGEARASRAV